MGENLIEQPNHLLGYSGDMEPSPSAYHTFVTAADLFGSDIGTVEALTRASLPKWAQAAADASGPGAVNATALEKLLRIQHDLIFVHSVAAAEILTAVVPQLLASNFWILLPFSRGSVHLGSADAVDEPVIDPRFFLADFDLAATVATAKMAQQYWRSETLRDAVVAPIIPGPDVLPDDATDDQWESYVRETREFSFSLLFLGP